MSASRALYDAYGAQKRLRLGDWKALESRGIEDLTAGLVLGGNPDGLPPLKRAKRRGQPSPVDCDVQAP